jgi:hypothetical protein
MSHLLDALEAYRADLAHGGRGDPFSERDTVWLAWASALDRVSSLHGDARTEHLRRVLEELPPPIAPGGLGPIPTARDDEHLANTLVFFALAISEEAEEAGAYATATVILHLAQASLDGPRGVFHGRLIARQARVLRRLGDLETADHRYGLVDALGAEIANDELRVRATLGRGIIARARGNYPVARELFLVVAAAEGDTWELHQLRGFAHQELLIVAAVAKDFDAALRHGWAAYQSPAASQTQRDELLINFASVCLDSGRYRAALNGYLRVLAAGVPRRMQLTAVGSAAIAAGELGYSAMVRRFIALGDDLMDDRNDQYEVADLEKSLAQASFAIGDDVTGALYRRRALSRADRLGFYEILHDTERLTPRQGRPQRTQYDLSEEAIAATNELESADSESLFAAIGGGAA